VNDLRLAIPLHGKMATRSFHSSLFRSSLEARGMAPLYFVGPHYFHALELDPAQYFELKTDKYGQLVSRHRWLRELSELRRFVVRTETTDLRLRESIEDTLFASRRLSQVWSYAAMMDILRRIPRLGELAAWSEAVLYKTHEHDQDLKSQAVDCVLTPGFGSYGFQHEGLFAREAQALGLPVISAITNYDNVVNRGFRSFMPDKLAVWSRLMADETVRLQRIPAARIEITGPVQYDRYFRALPLSREEFLQSKGLDPTKQTIFYAGGVNVSRYYEIFQLLADMNRARGESRCNLVIRPWPHPKVLRAPEWSFLEERLSQTEGVYASNPLRFSSDTLEVDSNRSDVNADTDLDELACLFKYSDVLINHFSTVSLEAAICDLPAIHVGYDDYTFGYKFNTTATFQRRQSHNLRKLRLEAARVAEDQNQLIEYINLYLADPCLDRAQRYDYALSECGPLDGLSGDRLAEVIKSHQGS
jgi:hypothetical protein